MKKYLVNVNGTKYEIGIEAMGEGEMPVKTESVKEEPVAEATAPAVKAAAGGETISAPMPGTILSVNVTNGQSVKAGDIIVILEAMKMENEILAPVDGTVTVNVTNGQNVETGTVICTIA